MKATVLAVVIGSRSPSSDRRADLIRSVADAIVASDERVVDPPVLPRQPPPAG